jgi:mRNA interferase MazF
MLAPQRGEVWFVDLGLAAKARPCLLLTGEPADDELALVTAIAHTLTVRGNPWELVIRKPFLKPGAFHLQEIHSIPLAKLSHKLGELTPQEMAAIDAKVRQRLRL